LLTSIADVVDIVEPVAKFTDALKAKPGVGMIFNTGLEDWNLSAEYTYDLVWAQWCLGHLTSVQLVTFLRKCAEALSEEGYIIVKENLTSIGSDIFHNEDNSVTRYVTWRMRMYFLIHCRCDENFRDLFREAGLKLVKTELQNGLPKVLFKVRMYALQPVKQ